MSQFAAVDSTEPRLTVEPPYIKNVDLLARVEQLLKRATELEKQISAMEVMQSEPGRTRTN